MSAHTFTVTDAATFRTWVEPDGMRCVSWHDQREGYSITLAFPASADSVRRLADMIAATVEDVAA